MKPFGYSMFATASLQLVALRVRKKRGHILEMEYGFCMHF